MEEEESNYHILENAIKNINLVKMNNEKNLNYEKIKEQLNLKSDSEIIIEKYCVIISYNNLKFEEYILDDENNVNISKIEFDGNHYKKEFSGYKLYCDDKILILMKELNKYSSKFTFDEINIQDNNKDHKNENKHNINEHIKYIIKDNNDNKNNDSNNNLNNKENNNEYYYYIYIKTNLFDKIDFHNHNIRGYKYYIYFIYIHYIKIIKKKKI